VLSTLLVSNICFHTAFKFLSMLREGLKDSIGEVVASEEVGSAFVDKAVVVVGTRSGSRSTVVGTTVVSATVVGVIVVGGLSWAPLSWPNLGGTVAVGVDVGSGIGGTAVVIVGASVIWSIAMIAMVLGATVMSTTPQSWARLSWCHFSWCHCSL